MTHDTEIIVRKYGLLKPQRWNSSADEQMRLMNVLWNTLVEIETDARARYHALMAEDSAVAAALATLTALKAEREALYEARKRLKARSGKRGKAAHD